MHCLTTSPQPRRTLQKDCRKRIGPTPKIESCTLLCVRKDPSGAATAGILALLTDAIGLHFRRCIRTVRTRSSQTAEITKGERAGSLPAQATSTIGQTGRKAAGPHSSLSIISLCPALIMPRSVSCSLLRTRTSTLLLAWTL